MNEVPYQENGEYLNIISKQMNNVQRLKINLQRIKMQYLKFKISQMALIWLRLCRRNISRQNIAVESFKIRYKNKGKQTEKKKIRGHEIPMGKYKVLQFT